MAVLVITTEPLPVARLPVTGAGLRAWALAEGLRHKGFNVEVGMPEDALGDCAEDVRREAAPHTFRREKLTEWVHARRPDVLVMQHWGLMDRLGEVDCPIAMDLAGPHLLERHFWDTPDPLGDITSKLAALHRADFLTCAGRRQRYYFLAYALQAGFDPEDPNLLQVIPYSVDPAWGEDTAEPEDPLSFVCAGFLLPWQDPAGSMEILLQTLESHQTGRFDFIGGNHPSGDMSGGRFTQLLERVDSSGRGNWMRTRPFQEVIERLPGYGVAMDLMRWNLEREMAFTSRTVFYLGCGVPVLHDDYSELGELIAEHDAGWAIPPERPELLRQLLEDMVECPSTILDKRANARRLAREHLSWDRTIDPLSDFCRNPVRRKRGGVSVGTELGAARELRGRRLVRFSEWLRDRGWHR